MGVPPLVYVKLFCNNAVFSPKKGAIDPKMAFDFLLFI